jgi:hypothetical protein
MHLIINTISFYRRKTHEARNEFKSSSTQSEFSFLSATTTTAATTSTATKGCGQPWTRRRATAGRPIRPSRTSAAFR